MSVRDFRNSGELSPFIVEQLLIPGHMRGRIWPSCEGRFDQIVLSDPFPTAWNSSVLRLRMRDIIGKRFLKR